MNRQTHDNFKKLIQNKGHTPCGYPSTRFVNLPAIRLRMLRKTDDRAVRLIVNEKGNLLIQTRSGNTLHGKKINKHDSRKLLFLARLVTLF